MWNILSILLVNMWKIPKHLWGNVLDFFWDKDVLRRELRAFASSVTGNLGCEPRLLTKGVTNVKAATGNKKTNIVMRLYFIVDRISFSWELDSFFSTLCMLYSHRTGTYKSRPNYEDLILGHDNLQGMWKSCRDF